MKNYTVEIKINEKTGKLTADVIDLQNWTVLTSLTGVYDTESEVYSAAFEWSKTQNESL